MTYLRQNVYGLGNDWADPILWYARGVQAMKASGLDVVTSWDTYGAIHGADLNLWRQLGYYSPGQPLPTSAIQDQFWQQCQHGCWYFLPWHRGYLIAFEANIRVQVVKLGGPPTWALPYWNYLNSGQSTLPPAFASPNWPDGAGNNPLFVRERYGPQNDGNVYIPTGPVNQKALGDGHFTGSSAGASPGFGGIDTGFNHPGATFGGVENMPHNAVHVFVGGNNPTTGDDGLMTTPDAAALDPIFWLHHANIDRLWEVWHGVGPSHLDPTDPKWLSGPASLGERAFVMPMPDGTTWTYTPSDMTDLSKLDYTYDDLTPPTTVPSLQSRLKTLGAPAVATAGLIPTMTPQNAPEMIGATTGSLQLGNSETRTTLSMQDQGRQKVARSLTAASVEAPPDRVFLNIENVRSASDAASYNVYVGLKDQEEAAERPDLLAGNISLFGARKASKLDGEHGGTGLTFVLDISEVVDKLFGTDRLQANSLDVALVPVRKIPEAANITIGRMSIYRQGQQEAMGVTGS